MPLLPEKLPILKSCLVKMLTLRLLAALILVIVIKNMRIKVYLIDLLLKIVFKARTNSGILIWITLQSNAVYSK